MPAITIIVIGFIGGLLTMSIINLYRHVLKILGEC